MQSVPPKIDAFVALRNAIDSLAIKRQLQRTKRPPPIVISPPSVAVSSPSVPGSRPSVAVSIDVLMSLPLIPAVPTLLVPTVAAASDSNKSDASDESDERDRKRRRIDAVKPIRLPKTAPVLAERGLVRLSKTIGGADGQQQMDYHELWFIVPTDYTLTTGTHHTPDERRKPVEIPVRILKPATFTGINDLLIPAQDVGKLIGVRQANISKDVISKICGSPTDNDRKTETVHSYGRIMDAPTPSGSMAGWQRQVCIRVEQVVAFLAGRKKPAGVDAVLLAGLKAYPTTSAAAADS